MNAARPLVVRRSAAARRDLLDIWLYIAEHDPAAADRLLTEIGAIFSHLAYYPRIGRERTEIEPGIRSLAVRSWVVLYRYADDVVDIVRVVHGARDFDDIDV